MSVATAPEDTLAFDPAGVPAELRELPQWVGWSWEERSGKLTKVPKNARTGGNADPTNPQTWSSLDEVIGGVARFGFAGAGFVFRAAGGLAGIDVDDGIDLETGELTAAALGVIDAFPDAYIERSVSGRGLHAIGRTRQVPNAGGGNKRGPVEVYWAGRFFVMTGRPLLGYDAPDGIGDCTEALLSWHRRAFPPKPAPAAPISPTPPELTLDDDEALARARRMAGFPPLFDHGDLSAYGGDHSGGDLGLLNYLVIAGVTDFGQLDRLHRASALSRDKWDLRRGPGTYGERTITKALDGHVRPFDGWMGPPASQERQDAARVEATPAPAPEGASCEIQLAIANKRIQEQAAHIQRLERHLAAAEARAKRSEEHMSRTVSVLGNDRLGPERFTGLALGQEFGCRKTDDDGWMRTPREAIGSRVGISPDTVSRHSTKLVKLGVLEKRLERLEEEVDLGTGEIIAPARTVTLYRIPAAIGSVTGFQDAIANLDPAEPKPQWGGQKACKHHPDAGTIKHWTIVCAECGETLNQGQDFTPARGLHLAVPDLPSGVLRQDAAPATASEPGTARCRPYVPSVALLEGRKSSVHPRPPIDATGTRIAAAWLSGQAIQPPPPLDSLTDVAYGGRRP